MQRTEAEQAPGVVTEVEALWTRQDLAKYLKCSLRWIDAALVRPPAEKGSVPHVELPSMGRRRQVRFVPDVIREWVRLGFPSVADFEALRRGA